MVLKMLTAGNAINGWDIEPFVEHVYNTQCLRIIHVTLVARDHINVYMWNSLFVVVCLAAGGLGAAATTPEIDGWYRTVIKPTWNPPDWVFGPVWTTLFVLMGIAGWLVWKSAGFKSASTPLTLFAVQLALNVAWSWIFFGMHQFGWAVVEIVILWLAILATAVAFSRHSKPAGWLLVPYLGWVTFASILNFIIWRLNAG